MQTGLIRGYQYFALLMAATVLLTGCDRIKGLLSTGPDPAIVKAYNNYRAAMLSGDVLALKKLVVKQKALELDAPGAEQMLALARSMYPAEATVTGVAVQGDAATLTVSTTGEGGTATGIVHLLKEDGAWKVYDEKWEMKMGESAGSPPGGGQGSAPDRTRPYEYNKLVGVWKGREAGAAPGDWTFTLKGDYAVTVEGQTGLLYRGEAFTNFDLGIEGNSLRVLPGGALFDVRITEAPDAAAVGKMSLGSYKLTGGVLHLCLGQPGLMKRGSDLISAGGIRCFELSKTLNLPAAPEIAGLPAPQPARPQETSPFRKQDPGVSGEAVIVKDGVTETYPVVTGFFSDTRFANPSRATVQFQASAPEHSNARRIEITLDATRTGRHHADGTMLSGSFMGSEQIRIGEVTSAGRTASFRWVADGGQIFWPKTSCDIEVTTAYTGGASSIFSGEVRDCPVHSAGIDYHISSVSFTMRGAPQR